MGNRLLEKDWLFILDTVYRLNELDELDAFRKETLKYLRLAIPFCQGIFYAYRIENDQYISEAPPFVLGDEASYLKEFHEQFSSDSLFGRYLLATRCEVIRDTDVYPDEFRTQTDWYRSIYVRQGIHYALRVTLFHNHRSIGEIDLFRPKDDDDFPDISMHMLDILAPHLAQKLWSLTLAAKAPVPNSDLVDQLADSHGLTPRECEVIAAIAQGTPDHQVAEQLCISPSTLKKHVHNAYRKMHVRNRRELFAVLNR